MKKLRRGNLIYYIYENKVIVEVPGDQWLTYNYYHNWNRQGITQLRQTLLKSKPDQYGDICSLFALATELEVRAATTTALSVKSRD